MKKKLTVENIKAMRNYGMTYQQIGDYYGVSRQYINKLCPYRRKYNIENIIYIPMYNLFITTPDLTVNKLCRIVFKNDSAKHIEKMRRFLQGKNVSLTLKEINEIETMTKTSISEMMEQKRFKGGKQYE